jgi:ADP-ribose pyrophosphatase YjhB (NUDIX family)
MTEIHHGERIGRHGELRLGCSAVIFNDDQTKILLTCRADNGKWCLPGGMIEAGESVSEACEREVFEETGLKVRVSRLTGVYSNPHQVAVYPDGKQAHYVILNFETMLVSGKPGSGNETTAVKWFTVVDAFTLDLFHDHADRISDAIACQDAAFIR